MQRWMPCPMADSSRGPVQVPCSLAVLAVTTQAQFFSSDLLLHPLLQITKVCVCACRARGGGSDSIWPTLSSSRRPAKRASRLSKSHSYPRSSPCPSPPFVLENMPSIPQHPFHHDSFGREWGPRTPKKRRWHHPGVGDQYGWPSLLESTTTPLVGLLFWSKR